MLFFLGFIFFQAVLVIGQDFPTICLDQGACYKGAWINTIHGGESGAFASFQGTVPKNLKKWDNKKLFSNTSVGTNPVCGFEVRDFWRVWVGS